MGARRFTVVASLPAVSVRLHLAAATAVLLFLGCGGGAEVEPETPTGTPVRLVVQADPGVDIRELRDLLQPELGSDLDIEPLFPDAPAEDPEQLDTFFIVRAPNGQRAGETTWDVANRVAEVEKVRHAEPDELAVLEAPTDAARAACFAGEDLTPADLDWSLDSIAAPRAWELEPPPGGKRFGDGIRICHPDTGWTQHDDLDSGRLDLQAALDLLTPGGNAHDPLEDGLGLNPGHGTGTASVIMSGHEAGRIKGVAPLAKLVPIRTAKSVIQVFDSDLARAVGHAATADCDVISMSLGGRIFFGLQAAVRHAARSGAIVAAAAGNCVRMVVAPAAYEECIAVAGTAIDDKPWRGSSRGRAVTVAGPAQHVWHAKAAAAQPVAGQGTSFAVANVAGAAALWLAYHGEEAFQQYEDRGVPLQAVFVALVKATARRPAGWNDKFGAGILDTRALLAAPLPPPGDLIDSALSREIPWTTVHALERVFDVDRDVLVAGLARAFDLPPETAAEQIESWGPEFVEIAMERPEPFLALFETTPDPDAVVPPPAETEAEATARRRSTADQFRANASARLREAL